MSTVIEKSTIKQFWGPFSKGSSIELTINEGTSSAICHFGIQTPFTDLRDVFRLGFFEEQADNYFSKEEQFHDSKYNRWQTFKYYRIINGKIVGKKYNSAYDINATENDGILSFSKDDDPSSYLTLSSSDNDGINISEGTDEEYTSFSYNDGLLTVSLTNDSGIITNDGYEEDERFLNNDVSIICGDETHEYKISDCILEFDKLCALPENADNTTSEYTSSSCRHIKITFLRDFPIETLVDVEIKKIQTKKQSSSTSSNQNTGND